MNFRFTYQLPVRFADTDAQGHVFFANYLTFCDEGLTAYLNAIDCPWQRLVAEGVDMFYVDASCQFRGRSRFGDTLAIATTIGRFGNTSFTSEYEVLCGDSGAVIAAAKLTSVCVESKSGVPVRVPDRLRAAVADYEQRDSQQHDQ